MILRPPSTPEEAVRNLGNEIGSQNWDKAYGSLANKAQFTEPEFVSNLQGRYPCLRTYATLDHFDVLPIHASDNEAEVRLNLYWSTVVGITVNGNDLHVVRVGSRWQPEWPMTKEQLAPPQVIPLTYLRWDVIERGPGDDWGAQDVEAPHVRIVDMRPIQRADGVVVLGELLNEDVVPAYVSVSATLLSHSKSTIGTRGCFDKISHLLLPKQVTPFLIRFPDVALSDVGSVRMEPFSALVSASADPVIEIDNVHLSPAPAAELSGQLISQSGQPVNVAHVLGTFYDKTGQVVWVADQYVDRALVPQMATPFEIHVPEDLAKSVSSQRTVVATYSVGGPQ